MNSIQVRYTNYKGETSVRKITPVGIPPRYMATKYHSEGWILTAYCHTKKATRDFEMSKMDFVV